MPSRDEREQVEKTTQVSHDSDQIMDAADPIFVPYPDECPESDFGPWLLVSRRCGSAWGRGGGASRASHVTPRTTDGVEGDYTESRGTGSHGLRGGSRLAGRGRSSTFHAFRDSPHPNLAEHHNVQNSVVDPSVDQTSMINDVSEINPSKTPPYPLVGPQKSTVSEPLSVCTSQDRSHPFRDHSPPNPSNQIVPFRRSQETPLTSGPSRPSPRPTSPPPTLRTSVPVVSTNTLSTDQSHDSLVAEVSSALESSEIEEDSDEDVGSSDDEDDDMPDDENEPDDSMTLV